MTDPGRASELILHDSMVMGCAWRCMRLGSYETRSKTVSIAARIFMAFICEWNRRCVGSALDPS